MVQSRLRLVAQYLGNQMQSCSAPPVGRNQTTSTLAAGQRTPAPSATAQPRPSGTPTPGSYPPPPTDGGGPGGPGPRPTPTNIITPGTGPVNMTRLLTPGGPGGHQPPPPRTHRRPARPYPEERTVIRHPDETCASTPETAGAGLFFNLSAHPCHVPGLWFTLPPPAPLTCPSCSRLNALR